MVTYLFFCWSGEVSLNTYREIIRSRYGVPSRILGEKGTREGSGDGEKGGRELIKFNSRN